MERMLHIPDGQPVATVTLTLNFQEQRSVSAEEVDKDEVKDNMYFSIVPNIQYDEKPISSFSQNLIFVTAKNFFVDIKSMKTFFLEQFS